MEIWIVDKPLRTNLWTFNIGDLLYKESYKDVPGTNNYYPFNGAYSLWDRNIDVEKYSHKIADTDKPKEYFINKVYSQYEWDEMLKQLKKQS